MSSQLLSSHMPPAHTCPSSIFWSRFPSQLALLASHCHNNAPPTGSITMLTQPQPYKENDHLCRDASAQRADVHVCNRYLTAPGFSMQM